LVNAAVLGPRHRETLRTERELGLAFRDANRHRDAEVLLRGILDTGDEETLVRSPFYLEVANDLGYALFQQARFDEAIEILRPTLARERALFGNLHIATLATMRALGSALRDQGNLDQAEALYRDAVRTARALYGEAHPETEGALLVLALGLERKNELVEAEALAREILRIAPEIHGPDHPTVWAHLAHLGAIRLDRGDPVEAERSLRQ